MDNKFTAALQSYLSSPPDGRSLEEGLDYLLRLTGSAVMVRSIRRSNNTRLLYYELNKHLLYRLDGLTRREVILMAKEVPLVTRETLARPTSEGVTPDGKKPPVRHRGRRADHDLLPEEIKRLYDEQAERYYKIRQTHFALQGMASLQPCDRYETLKNLAALDRKYREVWDRYDRFDLEAYNRRKEQEGSAPVLTPEETAVSTLRMQVTRALSRLEKGDFSKRTTKEMAEESLRLAVSQLERLEAEIKPETRERIEKVLS